MELLAGQARTVAALRERLARDGFAAPTIESALARLQELGLLDDRELARSRAERLLAERRLAPAHVVQRLVRQGIAEETACQAVRESLGETSERELAARALSQRRPPVTAGSPWEERVSAARFLVRRGFGEELVRSLLDLGDEQAGG